MMDDLLILWRQTQETFFEIQLIFFFLVNLWHRDGWSIIHEIKTDLHTHTHENTISPCSSRIVLILKYGIYKISRLTVYNWLWVLNINPNTLHFDTISKYARMICGWFARKESERSYLLFVSYACVGSFMPHSPYIVCRFNKRSKVSTFRVLVHFTTRVYPRSHRTRGRRKNAWWRRMGRVRGEKERVGEISTFWWLKIERRRPREERWSRQLRHYMYT